MLSLSDMDTSESASDSEPECCAVFEVLLFLRAYVTHSGVGWRRSYCRRRRAIYSRPLTMSSSAVSRSLRSRGVEASETVMRSSALSYQTGCRRWILSSSLDVSRSLRTAAGRSPVPASRKKRSSSGTSSRSASASSWPSIDMSSSVPY